MIESNGRFVASIVVLHVQEDLFFWCELDISLVFEGDSTYHLQRCEATLSRRIIIADEVYRWISVYGNLFIAYYISFCSLAYHSGSLPIGATSFLEYTYAYEERILEDMPHGSSIVYSQGTFA